MGRNLSVVTNTILHSSNGSPAFLDKINMFFEGRQKGFVSVSDPRLPDGWYGGSKYLERNLAIGAFNHLDLDRLVQYLHDLAPDDENLQLIVCE
jgi:hypothetical protein